MKFLIVSVIITSLLIPFSSLAYAFEFNAIVIEPPKGVYVFDLDYYRIGGDEGPGDVQKNKDAKQDTIKVHKSDHLNGQFQTEDGDPGSLKVFFTKSIKVHSDGLVFSKKYNLKNFACSQDNCNFFHGDVPSSIKKGNYQFVVWSTSDELQRFYITKSTIK